MSGNTKNRFLKYSLPLLQSFIGLTALRGGYGLVSDPTGATMDTPMEWIRNSPFSDYFIPGLILLIIIGLGNVLAALFTILQQKYSGEIAAILGSFLIIYMSIEIWFIGLRNFLQPIYLILGVIVLLLGLKLLKSANKIPGKEFEMIPNKLSA